MEAESGDSKEDNTITEPNELQHSVTTSDSDSSSANIRPKRTAAIAAADRVKACAVHENQMYVNKL